MRNDVISRLAAANPVPTQVQLCIPRYSPDRRRVAIAVAFAVAVAVPAVAFAGALGNLRGFISADELCPAGRVAT